VDIKNRMQTHPDRTMPMDVFGLQKRRDTVLRLSDEQPTKEDAMRYFSDRDVVLTLKDDSLTGPRPTQNWDEVRRLLMEAARKIDPTYSISEQETLCARLIQDMQRDKPTARSGFDYLLKVANDSNDRFAAEQRMKRWGQEVAAAMATPANKRIKPDYAKVY